MSETIQLYTASELGAQPSNSFQYPIDAFGQQIQMTAMENLGMNYDPHYSLFLGGPEMEPTKIKSKFTLRELGATDGMTLYVALVDPITGQPLTNATMPAPRPLGTLQPTLPRLNNTQNSRNMVLANKLPAIHSPAPGSNQTTPTPLILQSKLGGRPGGIGGNSMRPPPSILSIAQRQKKIPSRDGSGRSSHGLPSANGVRASSPYGNSQQQNLQQNSMFPPLAPSEQRTSARFNSSSYNPNGGNDNNNTSGRLQESGRLDTSRTPIPNDLQPFLCSMLDFEVNEIRGNIQFVCEKATSIPYVIKLLKGQISPDTFFKEFYNVFNSENGAILHLHGFITSPFSLVYESHPNGTLEEVLEMERISNAPSGWTATAKNIVLFGIAEGMRQLHSKRIMHRNLKPSNVILDKDYYPYIADVGFTREYNRNPSYMAPEMLAGCTYKSKVDIYSYGIILYQTVAMMPPFDTNISFAQVKQMVIDGERPEIPSTTPETFANLIRRCWSQESSTRPTFSNIVEGFVNGAYILPGADRAAILEYQRLVAPQYEAREFCKAAIVKQKADSGDVDSILEFAYLLMKGKGVIKNVMEGRRYFKMAADQGNPQAQYEHARCLLRFERDDEQAAKYLQKAAAFENRYAQKFLSNGASSSRSPRQVLEQHLNDGDPDAMYEIGEQMSKTNPTDAFKYFKMAADKGNVKGQLRTAIYLHNGLNGVQKDVKEANKYYRMAALQGNAKALCNLAFNMQRGDGIEKDVKTANDLYKKSADSGYSIAQYNYACNLMNGIGVNKNPEEANKLYKLAADQGHVGAQFSYASSLMKGNGIEKDIEKANEYFKLSSEGGNALAQCQLAMNYANGIGLEKSMEKANEYYKLSADQGNSRAQCNYAFSLQKGNGVKQDIELANKYYKLSADQNYAIAQYNYAFNLENGVGVDKNIEEANKYYKMAAEQGNANAQYNLAMNLMKGVGIKKDLNEATRLLKLSADQNNNKAQYQYAVNLFKGNGIEKDTFESSKYMKMSADSGNTNAQFYYGYNLFNGLGIDKNAEEANKYYKMAADKGNANSQCNLACSYLNGIGVEKDVVLANKYYRMSAECNNSVAMYNYGVHLLNGVGVEKDVEKGIDYLKKACDANNSSAQYCLAVCYETGNGVPKDKEKYAELIKKSAAAGNKLASQRVKKMPKSPKGKKGKKK